MKIFIALAYLFILAIVCKVLSIAKKPTPPMNIQVCTRRAPHVCGIKGPCNGWPKEKP
jgi:hypothetical protein